MDIIAFIFTFYITYYSLNQFIQTLEDLTTKVRAHQCLHCIRGLQRHMGYKIIPLCG